MRRLLLPFALVASIAAACASAPPTTTTTTTPTAPATTATTPAAPAASPADVRRVVSVNKADPIVNIRIAFATGSADDPAGKGGLTALTASLMKEATAELDAAALNDALFPMAAELNVFVDKEATVFIARIHRDHEQRFLAILRDVLTRPRFDDADFKRLRDEQLAFLQTTLRTGNDEALQREALELAIFPTGPYAHTPAGTVSGLQGITLDDVRAWKDAVFAVDRVVVGVSGGASAAFVDGLVASVATLPAKSAPRIAIPAASTTTTKANSLVIIDKPSAGTAISLGYALPSLDRAHPDYAAMKLAETWFGEHRNLIGHLFHSMREVRGLNYGDYAYVEHFVEEPGGTFERTNIPRQQQYFSMWVRPVEHKNRLFALKMTAWELARFVDGGIPDDASFKRVQDFVMGYWPGKEAEPMRALGYELDRVLTPIPVDRTGLRAAVKALTREQVNAAIARHLKKDGLRFVVVTEDAAALKAAIVDKTVPTLTVNGASADVVKDNAAIGAFDLGLDAASITVVPPSAFFER